MIFPPFHMSGCVLPGPIIAGDAHDAAFIPADQSLPHSIYVFHVDAENIALSNCVYGLY